MRPFYTALAVTVISCCFHGPASAQGLLDRLEKTLTEERTPEPLPAPRRNDGAASAPRVTGYPTLGVTVDPVTDAVARERNLQVRRGAIITAIVQGSPADRAGLPLGAVVVAFDGERIDGPKDLVAAVRSAPTNRPNEISYYDGPRLFRKRIQLLPGELAVPAQPPPAAPPTQTLPPYRQPPAVLEQALGEQGRRPVLGQVGRLLDSLVAPAAGEAPLVAPLPPPADDEIAQLRQQVALLQQQLAALQQQMTRIEQKLVAGSDAATKPADEQPSEQAASGSANP